MKGIYRVNIFFEEGNMIDASIRDNNTRNISMTQRGGRKKKKRHRTNLKRILNGYRSIKIKPLSLKLYEQQRNKIDPILKNKKNDIRKKKKKSKIEGYSIRRAIPVFTYLRAVCFFSFFSFFFCFF